MLKGAKYSGVKVVKDSRLDEIVSAHGYEFMKNVHVIERMPAEIMNKKISGWYKLPPFEAGTKVAVFECGSRAEFVRVYSKGFNEPHGNFIAFKKDIQGLTSLQIKEKFDLPVAPTHYSFVNPPAGTRMAMGIVKENNFGGKGGGTQLYFIGEVQRDWFSKGKRLDDG